MLTVTNFSFSFPNKDLYHEVNFTLEQGQCCAFIGASGTGKTTLAEMIVDPERRLFDGKIEQDRDYKIGYITQFLQASADDQTTVFDYIAAEFVALQAQIEQVCEQMGDTDDLDALLEQYQTLLDAFQAIDGDHYEHNIKRLLNLSNLLPLQDVAVSKISGGEFKLTQVIKQMLVNPHFLIMDEPDAFLDFENLNALKDLVNAHKGTMLIITHSRFLLNHCFNKILHLENMEIQEFDGRFIDYQCALLEQKVEAQELSFADDEEIKRNEILIDRLRETATETDDERNGRALNARVKINERLIQRRIKAPFVQINEPKIVLSTTQVVDDEWAVAVENLALGFGSMLFENADFSIKPTEKVAIIGANGTGKTTLLREIFKAEADEIRIHPDASIAYLSQQQGEMLKEENSVYDEFFDAGFESYESIETHLKQYGFGKEKMEQPISAFSGGEKNLLQLAKISAGDANLLLLDEPTSHLDTYAQIGLEKAINGYNGAILMVSHDFYFIANCMDYILMIENQTVRKMSCRKFRKIIYANHFDKNYLLLDQSKKQLETQIEHALAKHDFERAKGLVEQLKTLVEQM